VEGFDKIVLHGFDKSKSHFFIKLQFLKKVSAGQKISVEYFGINIFDTPHTKNVEIIDGIPVTVNFADDKHVQVKYIYETNIDEVNNTDVQDLRIVIKPNNDIQFGSSIVVKLPTQYIGYFKGESKNNELTTEDLLEHQEKLQLLVDELTDDQYIVIALLMKSGGVDTLTSLKGMTMIGVDQNNETHVSTYKNNEKKTDIKMEEISREHTYMEINFDSKIDYDENTSINILIIGKNIFHTSHEIDESYYNYVVGDVK